MKKQAIKTQSQAQQPFINPSLNKVCAQAALAAYADLINNTQNVQGFTKLARFYGCDTSIFGNSIERFGLIFEATNDPSILLFAFRGTVTKADADEDAWAIPTAYFQAYNPGANIPNDVEVHGGIYSIYTATDVHMPNSMQAQLFAFLNNRMASGQKISKLIITGHSLGAALATFFAFDVAASIPRLPVINLNFANPRLGYSKWQNVYNSLLYPYTIQIVNNMDVIPYSPPFFYGVGQTFQLEFYVKDYNVPHPELRHSMLNYQYVLAQALGRDPQVWVGEFPDQSGTSDWTMQSVNPVGQDIADWDKVFKEFGKRQ